MKYLHLGILFLMQAYCFLSFSQTDAQVKFTHLTTNDGLSQSTVYAILKDYKGFMWFATDEGLNKYDGYKFTVYKNDAEDPGSIINNSVYCLLEDDAHNLWVVTAGGVDRFNRTNESFIHYSREIIFKNIFQDSKKRIWLGSTEGFCLFNAGTGTFKFYKNNPNNLNSLSHNYVTKITEDNHGELWIATRNGLNRFNLDTKKFIHFNNEPANNNSISSGYIKTVYKDSKGNIWAGTQGSGIALFDGKRNSFINFKNDPKNKNSICHNDILSFAEDTKGNLWIGTENGGISLFNYSANTFVSYRNNENDPFSISGNSVYSIYKDDIGNMWAGTWSGGVNFLPFSRDKFTHYRKIPNNSNSLSNNLVLSISGDPDNNLWIGTDGGGLNRFDMRTHNFTHYQNNKINKKSIHNNYVLSVSEYLQGILAVGFHRGGIDLFDVEKQLFTNYALKDSTLNRLISPSVNVVYKDRQNNLWLGLHDNRGIYKFDKKAKQFTNFFASTKDGESIASNTVFAIYETKAGQLCIGGDKGFYLFERSAKKFNHYQHDLKYKQSLSNNAVYVIMEDNNCNLWLGTANGLNFFNIKTKEFTIFTEKDGLPNNTIWAIQIDRQGNLWISTNKGLSRFNPSTKIFKNYTIIDGLQSNTFNRKASYQSADGEMFFGGINGFNSFFPDSIKDNDFVPPVYITDFQLFNKPVGIGGTSPLKQSVNEVKEIILSYKQSVFTIEFAALNFTQPTENLYAYKLEGFDKEWNQMGKKHSATYTNLNPGTYVFRVKGSNNDGVWNEEGVSLKIIITPPFWLTWWFKLLTIMAVTGGAFCFYYYRVKIVQVQKNALERRVKLQTAQLLHLNDEEHRARVEAEKAHAQSDIAREHADRANKELERKNKELEQFAYVASHDLQEPLRTSSSYVQLIQKQYKGQLDDRADKYFNYIVDSSDRMKTLIKDLLDFSRIGIKKEFEKVDCVKIMKDVLADLDVAITDCTAVIKYENLPVIDGYPTEIKQLFQNLIINAIKFRNKNTCPEIHISAIKIESYWQFAFKDNGIGIDKQHNEKIFIIFQRLHNRTEYKGSGIGLSHCKKIVELHHGKIWVKSQLGKGSTFYFTLAAESADVIENDITKTDFSLEELDNQDITIP
jgi:signal transduction histidine kinase/ligand-binding sensor domain-containing protein